MAATCPTSSSTPPTSPAPCAPVPACGLELARSSTAFPKKTLEPLRPQARYGRLQVASLSHAVPARLREGQSPHPRHRRFSPKRMPKTVQLQNGVVTPLLRNLFGSHIIKGRPFGVGFECLAHSLQERNTLYD